MIGGGHIGGAFDHCDLPSKGCINKANEHGGRGGSSSLGHHKFVIRDGREGKLMSPHFLHAQCQAMPKWTVYRVCSDAMSSMTSLVK